ncbi:Carboxylesterase type B [Piromyces finnis]|uniref:Carboxylic ester hydrolase n=1 Tax=Piromyces finnis TaxID=1754191 RepID=A0A1Y1UCE6_9FUNG|nr:Carboxylesterase type B [Piromyces finnis]ORX40439.1 Carboxylesterase type B [Piromyces finnis]|eukprot:ORX35194.1 Carboxylesterase type B [Piromyces finnis]
MKILSLVSFLLFSFFFIDFSNSREVRKFGKRKQFNNELIRNTKFGSVEGTKKITDDGDVLVWYNIPYAEEPTGNLRWAAPVDPQPWNNILDCTVPGEVALQMDSDNIIGTEDCLNLDIYAPKNAKKLPVMVYIHGGNNQTGESKELKGNDIVIRNNVIYISINYRLGIFGFNILPALHTEAGSTGNYALLDMAKALDWIKNNVKEFGGDPNNITISGFSAGGRDVMAMLISPLFAKKFHKAIVFSGGMTIADVNDSIKRTASAVAPLAVEDNMAATEEEAKTWLMTDGMDVKEWLYSVSSERLCALMGNAGIRMSVFPHLFNDGVVIPEEGFSTSKWNDVPVLMLTGSTEFSFFNLGSGIWYTPSAFALGTDLQPAKDFACTYGSDMYRIFNAQSSAEKMFNKYKSDIYVCQVDFGAQNSGYPIEVVGSFHGIFIPMLSNDNTYSDIYDFESSEYQDMAAIFNKQLKNFLRRGNPNEKGNSDWKPWTPSQPLSMVLDAVDGKATAQCKNVSTSFAEIISRMEDDISVSDNGKTLAITNVLNGRWFSEPVDEYYNNPSLWE